jgi:uncharacterized membrane protein (Fun14 family)
MEENVTMNEPFNNVSHYASESVSGIKGTVKDILHKISSKIQAYKGNLLELVIYLGIGFVVGFLLKKYFKYVLLLILFIVSLVILEQFSVIRVSVNWVKIQELLNFQQTETPLNVQVSSYYVAWVKENFIVVLSASVGFLVGLKLG